LRHLYKKCIILPRQARDKHRENSKKEWRFLRAVRIEQGGCVLHDGKVEHAGVPISSGRRMIMVGFIETTDQELPDLLAAAAATATNGGGVERVAAGAQPSSSPTSDNAEEDSRRLPLLPQGGDGNVTLTE
jgi:hypothetical protein